MNKIKQQRHTSRVSERASERDKVAAFAAVYERMDGYGIHNIAERLMNDK